MTTLYAKTEMKVADELFLALALLQREHPHETAFPVEEVIRRAAVEGFGARPESLRAHAHGHAAANLPPGKNGRYRLLFKQEDGRVRLVCASDYMHPDRHQKLYPALTDIPPKYHELVEWARHRSEKESGRREDGGAGWLAGLQQLRGLGRDVWQGVRADDYVRGLREGWE